MSLRSLLSNQWHCLGNSWRRASQQFCVRSMLHQIQNNMSRVITTHYLNIPQLLNADLSKTHPFINNIFNIKLKHAPLTRGMHYYGFDKLTKGWRESRLSLSLEFYAFVCNQKCCVVRTIKCWVQVTRKWRK